MSTAWLAHSAGSCFTQDPVACFSVQPDAHPQRISSGRTVRLSRNSSRHLPPSASFSLLYIHLELSAGCLLRHPVAWSAPKTVKQLGSTVGTRRMSRELQQAAGPFNKLETADLYPAEHLEWAAEAEAVPETVIEQLHRRYLHHLRKPPRHLTWCVVPICLEGHVCRGDLRAGMVAACVYFACKLSKAPRSKLHVASTAGVM